MNELRYGILVAGLLIVASPAAGQEQKQGSARIPVPQSRERPSGMRELPGGPDTYVATYRANVEYVRRGERSLVLQILEPRDRPPPIPGIAQPPPRHRPLVVYVQGSAWLPQDLYAAIPQLADLAHHGYVVASVEYRASTEAIAPAQIQDVKTAIRYLRANADKYDIDPRRVGIWGDSSGGHLAALVATTVGLEDFATGDYASEPDDVQAVVDFYGVSDIAATAGYPSWLEHDAEGSPEALLLGGLPSQNLPSARANSPVTYVTEDRDLPPFLLVHGDMDAIVPFNQSVRLYEALRTAGQEVEFYSVKGGNHGFDFWSPQLMQLVIDFLDANLKGETR